MTESEPYKEVFGDAIEVSEDNDEIVVRHIGRPEDGELRFTRAEIAAFIAGCKAGEFDDIG